MLRRGAIAALLAPGAFAGVTSPYTRGRPAQPLEIGGDRSKNSAPASQVFVSPAAEGGITVGWVTDGPIQPGSAPAVRWRCTNDDACSDWQTSAADTTSYSSGLYKSGDIHHATINAPRGARVAYSVDGRDTYEVTVPRGPGVQDAPFSIAVVGDLGQTENSVSTVQHLLEDTPDLVVVPGDLSYADCDQARWDSWGRLAQPMTSSAPLLSVPGNHEAEWGCGAPFQAYQTRFRMPVAPGSSASTMHYSFEAGGVHFVMLSSYSPIGPGSDQLSWLEADLRSVDRQRTPWLVAALHAPWFNSNSHHQGEGEPREFAVHAEPLLIAAGADIVFAGHVHAYERSLPSSAGRADRCGATFITIGDGGNREGLAMGWLDPQPEWSAFRESSYGHGRLVIQNSTHAVWTWHRNQEGEKVAAEEVVIAADAEGCPNSRQQQQGAAAAERRKQDGPAAPLLESGGADSAAEGGARPRLRPLKMRDPQEAQPPPAELAGAGAGGHSVGLNLVVRQAAASRSARQE